MSLTWCDIQNGNLLADGVVGQLLHILRSVCIELGTVNWSVEKMLG